jgi:hypothetical protein
MYIFYLNMNKEDVVGGQCSKHGRQELRPEFGRLPKVKRSHAVCRLTYKRIILKLIFVESNHLLFICRI